MISLKEYIDGEEIKSVSSDSAIRKTIMVVNNKGKMVPKKIPVSQVFANNRNEDVINSIELNDSVDSIDEGYNAHARAASITDTDVQLANSGRDKVEMAKNAIHHHTRAMNSATSYTMKNYHKDKIAAHRLKHGINEDLVHLAKDKCGGGEEKARGAKYIKDLDTLNKGRVADMDEALDVYHPKRVMGKWVKTSKKSRNEANKMLTFKDYKELYETTEAAIDLQLATLTAQLEEGWKKEHPSSSELVEIHHKLGDTVIPTVGPHKGHPHKVIGVRPDGYHIQPIGLTARQTKYNLGAAHARHDQLTEAEMGESTFDWQKKPSEIDWKGDAPTTTKSAEGGTIYKARETPRNPYTGGKADPKSVGRPSGTYDGIYKIDRTKRDTKEYKDALSAKVRGTKAAGFADRAHFKDVMHTALKKRQAELYK